MIVIFGGNGDLAKRKLLPALFHLHLEGLMPREFKIIGNSRKSFSTEQFRDFARASLEEFGRADLSDEVWSDFSSRLEYVAHEFTAEDHEPVSAVIEKAGAELGEDHRKLFYLSIPPLAFASVTEAIGAAGLRENARVVFEKPFGKDLESFKELDEVLQRVLEPEQIFTIDHFLGKETVQNILALRFANGMFEPVWNRHHVDHVQIDVPEELGIGSRAGFYEGTGALRDMLVTHLFQVLSFIAMEPPATFEPKFLHDEAVKVFESMEPLKPEDVVLGQYDGYRSEDGVESDSQTDTFVAARVQIDNWRWAGVPFFLRTGKKMQERRSSVTLAFREPPRRMFREIAGNVVDNDHLTLELGPREGISVTFLAKVPGPEIELGPARMEFSYDRGFGSGMLEAYERLILDALDGDHTLFTRGDGIGRVWEVVDPVLKSPPLLHMYDAGSWGPDAATELIAPRRWHLPDDMELPHSLNS